MIAVSNAWKAAQNQTLLPEMFVEVTYTVTEPSLQEEASVAANYPEDYSNVAQITDGLEKHSEAYATLDYGCWGLDGSFSYFDGTPVDPGYVDRNYSDANGSLDTSTHPIITIDFDGRHSVSIPGVVITWGKAFHSWATDFIVSAYNSTGMVAQTVVRGNDSPVSVVALEMVDYSRITIEILKWSHPYQRPRCIDVYLGVKNIYTKTDLLGYDHNQTADLLSAALPQNSITFKLRNDDGRWNPDNPTGFERYLLEQQEVSVRYGMDIGGEVEWIKGGTFWLSEWSTPANGLEAVFTARDAVGFMDAVYGGRRSGTLYEIAMEAFAEANLPTRGDGSVRYIVDESLKLVSTDFSNDDNEYIISEVLQMVAHAGCCVFYQDRDGMVHIEPRNETYSGYIISPSISYAHPEYEMNKLLKAISVRYGEDLHERVEVASRGEVQTIDNAFVLTRDDAFRVAETAKRILENRKTISGEFRADMRMDVLDNVIVESKYASSVIAITEVNYSNTGGAFRGRYTGRVVSVDLQPKSLLFSGDLYVGEI
jgi:hypothetical protein